ncbi:hypothetical protein VKT23_011324 [Stygiomarasmius scandens]|uniref:Uncharacterized protein n=1 Tax=Marasmiellus scandens TaxID=2682957 RepID=A0ABR1JE98_9AGAR
MSEGCRGKRLHTKSVLHFTMNQINPTLGFDPRPSPGQIALCDTTAPNALAQLDFGIPAIQTGPIGPSQLLPSAIQTSLLPFLSQAYPTPHGMFPTPRSPTSAVTPASSSSSAITSDYAPPPPSTMQFSTTMQTLPTKWNSSGNFRHSA